MDALSAVISDAEVDIFADFCREIGVENIREFEDRQLKAAEAEDAARHRFTNQIARLKHQ